MTTKDYTLTQNELKEAFNYDPETGVFTWIVKTGRRVSVGDVAGSIGKHGGKSYRLIMYKKRSYLAHRLAWLYVCGKFPEYQIDHVDGNGLNNKIDNLRAVTNQENHRNRRLQSNNTSGCIGVFFNKHCRKWQSHIMANWKKTNLGYYDDFFEAVCSRKSAENKYGYHHNHGQIRPL